MSTFALSSIRCPFPRFRILIQVTIQFACVAILLGLTLRIGAQTTAATLSGTITDQKGALVPNVQVTITNEDTGVAVNTKTNSAGIYSVPGLNPGRYRVLVEKQGFKQVDLRDLTLNVQDTVSRNFTLEVGGTSETIQVNGSGININTTDGSVSTVIDQQFVANIPLNGRSFQDLILLTPGVETVSPQYRATSGYSGEFSVNGQRTESNVYTVDGVSANTGGSIFGQGTSGTSGSLPAATALGTTQSLVSVDALQEFRVESSSYSAEYGFSPGGQFSFATRSGTKTFHGNAFDYLRNNYFDANDWFNNDLGVATPAERQNDFGGTLGGPLNVFLRRNASRPVFFFFSYEGLRLTQPQAAQTLYVPSTDLRLNAATAIQPFLNAFPVPIGQSLSNGLAPFVQVDSLPSSIDSISFRLDHQVTSNTTFFFRFSDTQSTAQTRSYSDLVTAGQSSYSSTLGGTTSLTSKITNEARLNYTSNQGTRSARLDNFGGAVPLDLLHSQSLPPSGEFDFAFDFPGYQPQIVQYSIVQPQHAWNAVDSVAVSHKKQNIKIGVNYRQTGSHFHTPSPEVFSLFNNSQNVLANNSFLTIAAVSTTNYPVYTNVAAYAQDEIRLSSRLALSVGLRWEVNPPPTQSSGILPYIVQGDLAEPGAVTLGPAGTRFWKTTYLNFAPRFGLAWRLNNESGRETVVRTGGGVFFDSGQQDSTQAFGNSPGDFSEAVYSNVSLPLPPALTNLTVTVPPVPPYAASAYYFPQLMQLPYTLQWNVSLDQSLGKDQALTLSYVGSNGRRLLSQQYLYPSSGPFSANGIVVENTGTTSSYNAFQVKFQRALTKGLQVLASYNWSHSIDFGSQDLDFTQIRGNSDYDLRNNFNAAVSYDVPSYGHDQFFRRLTEQWGIDGRLSARSGFPMILDGNEIIQPNGQTGYSGLNLIPTIPVYLYGAQCPNLPGSRCPGGRTINPAAFALPAAGNGDAPRNFVRGFGENQVDLAVRRVFPIVEKINLQFRAEAFNILNHPNFGTIQPTYGNVQFGQAIQMLNQSLGGLSPLYQQGGSRSMQFALKLQF